MDSEAHLKEVLDRFEGHLVATGKSANAIKAYIRDVRVFSQWFLTSNGKPLSPEVSPRSTSVSTGPIQVRVNSYRPATANRKLASLSAFCYKV